MKVELLYFDGCPSWRQALANTRAALIAEGLPDEVGLVRIESELEAESRRLVGSPTLRIDDVDLEGAAAEERGYGLGCRVYPDEGRVAGWPSVSRIRHALRRNRPEQEEVTP